MAASALLDTIINETIHRSSFGGSALFEQSLLKNLPTSSAGSTGADEVGATASLVSQQQADQIDSLSQMYATVEMGSFERFVWIMLFSLMVLIAAGGNIFVVYIVSTNKEMKSVTNYFLVNLSLADTMVSTLNVIFNFISMLNSHWPFGTVYCKISNFIAILSISASVFTLTAISCDRYNAILHPLRPRMSHSHAIGWILLIWTLSSALAIPNAIYSTVVEDRLANENIGFTCTMLWPDGRYPLSSYDHIYNIVILVVTYLVPIFTMAILYYQVGKELWGYEAIGENIDKQQRAILAKKKIVKMMIVVVIIFALCWLPYHAFFVVNYYMPNIFQDMPLHYQRCYLFMYWLAMSNSMYNPIIIYFMNSNFRHEFRKILSLLCCCRVYHPPIRSINSNSNNNNNTVRAPTTNHTQVKRQATQDSQTKNLIFKSTIVDKTNNLSATANNNIDVVVNHNGSSLAQDVDNVTVVIETKKLAEQITNVNTTTKDINNYISNNNIERLSEIDSAGDTIKLHHHYQHQHHHHHHQPHHHRQSLVNDMSKSEQEKEPFIPIDRVNSNHLVSEKLIDFAASAANNNSINSVNNPKLCLIESNNNKVWI